MFKRVGLFLCGLCVAAALISCGEEELGAGIGEFTTVNASASSSTGRLESDLITGNTCAGGTSTGGALETDYVDVNFRSTAMFATGALDLVVSKITVHYTPANASSPALPDYVNLTTQTIPPDSTVPIPVPVVPEFYKRDLILRTTQNLTACGGDIFEYSVRVTFEVSEPGGNGKIKSVVADMQLAIADRND